MDPNAQSKKFERKKTRYTPDNIPFRVIYQIYFFGIGLILLILASIALSLFSDKLEDYNYVIDNWNQDVVINIQAQNNCTSLGQDYTIMTFYKWPGTKDGCDCRTETRNNRILQSYPTEQSIFRRFYPQNKIYDNHECNSTQKSYGCETVPSQPEKEFKLWPSNNNLETYSLCAQRLQGYSWAKHSPISNQCENDQIMCGSDQPDAFFCVPKDQKCPIVEISFQQQPNLDESINIGSTQKLYFTRRYKDQLPKVEFRISEDKVCLKNKINKLSPGRVEYPLMKQAKEDCPVDERFSQINQVNELEYFRVNQMADLPSKLNGFILSDQYQWGLFQRSIIQWKLECRGDLQEKFINQKASLDHIKDCQVSLLIISLIFFLIISIVLSIISCMNICGYDWPCISGAGTQESNIIFKIEAILKCVIQLAHAIIILITFATVQAEINFFGDVEDKQCSDLNTQNVITSLKNVLKEQIYGYNVGQLVLFFVTTFFDCIVAGKLCCDMKFKKAKEYEAPVQIPERNEENGQFHQNPEISNAQYPIEGVNKIIY